MNGMKETKVLNKEGYFIGRYEDSAEKLRDIQLKQNAMSNIPRLSIETVMMVGILSMFAIFVARDTKVGTGSMLSQIALLGMVAMRIMPSSNRIVQALNNIAYYEPSLTAVEDIIVHAHELDVDSLYSGAGDDVVPMKFEDRVELSGITYRYPNTEVDILKNADLTIPIGKSIGLIGPSGAGKSTAVDLLLGLLAPQEGSIRVDGVDIRDNPEGWYDIIGYVPQMMFMLDDTIRNNVAYGVDEERIDDDKVWAALKEAQMDEYVRGLPLGLDTSIGERGVRISGGQRQRIGIARALYSDPQIMIFDEATSALDNDTESAIMEAIEKLHGKKTLIIVAHRLTTIANCDAVYKVDGKRFIPQDKAEIAGRIVNGDTEEEALPQYQVKRAPRTQSPDDK
ncbi:MAG: ABC transporter ATP-binding protein, partial [Lachnospiraceae bacterium]|nr:ABC transporter ATP-binding protein [Lachnospiraceae bacterium]